MGVRAKIRQKYGLQEQPSDFIAACILSPLAVCQESREIISREKKPSEQIRTSQPLNDITATGDSEVTSSHTSSHAS